jgi:hypothetical protein
VSISYSGRFNGTATTADGDFTAAAGKLEFSGAAGETREDDRGVPATAT